MLRRFITFSLFCFTVPFAVFGQEKFGHDDVKRLGTSVSVYMREQWPQAQESLIKNLPKAAKTAATAFNAMDPGAGPESRKTVVVTEQPFPWLI
ncbi:MAG TPA: hypothetical protein VGF14_07520 [Alphaproteobacteria bacterium]